MYIQKNQFCCFVINKIINSSLIYTVVFLGASHSVFIYWYIISVTQNFAKTPMNKLQYVAEIYIENFK